MTSTGLQRAFLRGRAERSTTRRSMPRFSLGVVVAPLGAFIALILLWQAVAVAELVPADMLPAPTRVLSAAGAERQALLHHSAPTLFATLIGFVLSVSVAFLTAMVLDFSALLRRAVLP